jgi:Domain of unknown function (DUF3475)
MELVRFIPYLTRSLTKDARNYDPVSRRNDSRFSIKTLLLSSLQLSERTIVRASIAGLEKAVEVLDTLGSSMSSLNTGSGFISGATNRGNRISILAFEVANTIAKAATLWRSFSDESIRVLKEDILKSDGVKFLVSSDERELLCMAAADKRLICYSVNKTNKHTE